MASCPVVSWSSCVPDAGIGRVGGVEIRGPGKTAAGKADVKEQYTERKKRRDGCEQAQVRSCEARRGLSDAQVQVFEFKLAWD